MLTKLIIFVNTREYILNPGGILISTIMWKQLLFLCVPLCVIAILMQFKPKCYDTAININFSIQNFIHQNNCFI